MAALTAVFSRLLSMAVAALPVMALVLAVRAALGRAPARYRYGLWLAVGFRLACPVSVARLWSLFNLPGVTRWGRPPAPWAAAPCALWWIRRRPLPQCRPLP